MLTREERKIIHILQGREVIISTVGADHYYVVFCSKSGAIQGGDVDTKLVHGLVDKGWLRVAFPGAWEINPTKLAAVPRFCVFCGGDEAEQDDDDYTWSCASCGRTWFLEYRGE